MIKFKKNNKIVIVEANYCHGECLPGYVKYLSDMGYSIDIILTWQQRTKNPLFMYNDIKIKYLTRENILNFLNSPSIKRYDYCLLNSNIIYDNPETSIFNFFSNQSRHTKMLCVEHHHENLQSLSQKAVPIVLKNFSNSKNAFEVNPHYFGDILPHRKNLITKFIVVGYIKKFRKNYNLLISAAQELLKQKINNFKIIVIGKGDSIDIPEELLPYFDLKGYLLYPDMYVEMANADYFLPLLDPENPEHERYITCGTSGSFQLIYGFCTPCIIAQKFATKHNFTPKNSLLYDKNEQLSASMVTAINMSAEDYDKMQAELHKTSKNIYNKSFKNLKKALKQSRKINIAQLNAINKPYRFLPFLTCKCDDRKKSWRFFGLPVFKKTLSKDGQNTQYYILGLKILNIAKKV